jgi:hypothetical protein
MARPPADEKVRFLKKVKQMQSGCHEWQASLHRDGYGKFYFRGKDSQSHRSGYQILVGPIPDGQWVLHRCDNRKCVNPEHLFLGVAMDNIQDMDRKGRRGTNTVFSESDVSKIKTLLAAGVTQQKVADAFGVHQTSISRIKLRKRTLFKKD